MNGEGRTKEAAGAQASDPWRAEAGPGAAGQGGGERARVPSPPGRAGLGRAPIEGCQGGEAGRAGRILTADFHAAEGGGLLHGLAALGERGGAGPARHGARLAAPAGALRWAGLRRRGAAAA